MGSEYDRPADRWRAVVEKMANDWQAEVAALREENARLKRHVGEMEFSAVELKAECHELRAYLAALVTAVAPYFRDGYCDPTDKGVIAVQALLRSPDLAALVTEETP